MELKDKKENILELRDYQKECIGVIDAIKPGSYMVVLPTGAGKTVIFSHIKRHGRILILSHREELVHQPIKYFDCPCGIEQEKYKSNGEEVVSASVSSFIRRLDRFKPDDFDMIITDEAHHAAAPSYQKVYSYFKPRLHLGFTATPNRADKKALSKIFEKIIYKKDIKWAITEGYLCNVRCTQIDVEYDLTKCRKVLGDYDQEGLDEALNNKRTTESIAKVYHSMAKGPTLIFAVNVRHCYAIATALIESGLKHEEIAVVTGETKNRHEIMDLFTQNKIKCIVNCMVLTEGTDLPCIETIIMARPTSNQSLYTQAVGRGLRLYPGKDFLNLIDCVGVSGKLRLCTAPSLFGIDETTVPKKERKKLQGKLITDIENLVPKLLDTPEAWIINSTAVELFSEEEEFDTRDLNFTISSDQSLYLPVDKHHYFTISPADELGQCTLQEYLPSKKVRNCMKADIQTVIDALYRALMKNGLSSRNLWDKSIIKNSWGNDAASSSQITLIKRLLKQTKRKKDCVDYDNLNKMNASIIIKKLTDDVQRNEETNKK